MKMAKVNLSDLLQTGGLTMAMAVENTKFEEAIKLIFDRGLEGMGPAMQILLNEAMVIERSRYLQTEPYERSEHRQDWSNGFKPKQIKTRVGELALQVPQVRSSSFYPSCIEKGIRSERALTLSLAEMYIQGVSTRKVNEILQGLCGLEITSTEVSRAANLLDDEIGKWKNRPLGKFKYLFFDARYEKVREGGRVLDCAVLVAYGINLQGKREILGLSVALSEAEVHWRNFFESLVARGLHGIELIVSDAHSGLKAALRGVFPGVPWQRCQFHLQQNAQSYVTKTARKKEVAETIRAIFNAENLVEAERLLKLAAQKYEKDMPKLSEWMLANIPESLAVFNFESSHRRRLRTSNIAERVNREIHRRTQVVSIFPNPTSCERLIGSILMEISEGWLSEQTYLSI